MAEELVNVNTGADAEVDTKKLKEERKRLKAEQRLRRRRQSNAPGSFLNRLRGMTSRAVSPCFW